VTPAPAAAGIPVAIYPFKVPGLSGQRRADFDAILRTALAQAARRGIITPRAPLLLAASCGDAPEPACLARLAQGGVVLAGRGDLRSGVVLVSAQLWDARGQGTREVRFSVDLVIENLRPVSEALLELELELEPDGTVGRPTAAPGAREPRAPPSVSAVPLPPPPAPKGAPPTAKGAPPAARPPAAPRPLPLAAPAPAPSSWSWQRIAGPALVAGGLALAAGGAAIAVLNGRRAADLDDRYARGTLTPADRSAYDRVRRDNVLSTALLAAGGVVCAGGAWIWISAPSPGHPAVAAVGGRF
jgi:hypothetical protein